MTTVIAIVRGGAIRSHSRVIPGYLQGHSYRAFTTWPWGTTAARSSTNLAISSISRRPTTAQWVCPHLDSNPGPADYESAALTD